MDFNQTYNLYHKYNNLGVLWITSHLLFTFIDDPMVCKVQTYFLRTDTKTKMRCQHWMG